MAVGWVAKVGDKNPAPPSGETENADRVLLLGLATRMALVSPPTVKLLLVAPVKLPLEATSFYPVVGQLIDQVERAWP